MTKSDSLTIPLVNKIIHSIKEAGGWIGFDQFMALALYAPGQGYYANDSRKFGAMPQSGSDFVTAPELSPHFGRALSRQIAQALKATNTSEIWEFGAGSGALAEQILGGLALAGVPVKSYNIVDISGTLRQRQQQRLAPFKEQVAWVHELPPQMHGIVVGNEVLDAMPVKLLMRLRGVWHERGVALEKNALVFADRTTTLRPPCQIEGQHDYLTEIHEQAEGFVRTLADRLQAGAAFFLDYGFPQAEYYHAQRSMGTLMCHRGHLADSNPLAAVGEKDITTHVNFTGVALASQEAGWHVLGYTSQAHFLINCGVLDGLEQAPLQERTMVQKLIHEHEMGELFKVIGFAASPLVQPYDGWSALGFSTGERSHRL